MNQNNIVTECTKCGAKNRIPKTRLQNGPLCGKCGAPLATTSLPARPVNISDKTFDKEVLSYGGPVLVDCWAPWCGPCKMVAPVLDQLASEYKGRIKITKLNVDENPLTASKYGIQSIPTMLLFKGGNQVDTLVGALPKHEIERQIETLL